MEASRDLRERIAEALDLIPDEKIRQLIEESLLAEKAMWATVTCKNPKCGKSYRYSIPVPNWGERAKVLDALLTQSKGKPAEAPRAVTADTATQDVEAMSLAELEAEERRLLAAYPELAGGEQDGAPKKPRRRRAAAR